MREWEKFESSKAVVDVDVRGWLCKYYFASYNIEVYNILIEAIDSPHKGPLSSKNRILVGIARQLSGVPAPRGNSPAGRDSSPDLSSGRRRHESYETSHDQERIARGAEEILMKGAVEEDVATRGGYSETHIYEDSDSDSMYGGDRNRNQTRESSQSSSFPAPGSLSKKATWSQPSDMSPSELATANANLMARLMPFLTSPLVNTPITIFYYNEKKSQSKTTMTDEAGHFSLRAALDFIPTHCRVLASESLSATEEVKVAEPKGVSLISDIDDTIKHSSIGGGAREMFRNTFIRDLSDLAIDGVKEWYNTLYNMGVSIHYVSNSPWQLFPVLMTFFRTVGLPPGSYHLKKYSGMLQGIFEPVAERKKGTLEKIMRDFPERKFLLVGDSGEADLELYTDIAVANPGRVIGIFIRDVTTPSNQGFFDSATGDLDGDCRGSLRSSPRWSGDKVLPLTTPNSPETRPRLPPRLISTDIRPRIGSGPAMGKLVDFEDEPEEITIGEPQNKISLSSLLDLEQLDSGQKFPPAAVKVPPPRPIKPLALKGLSAGSKSSPVLIQNTPPPPLPPRKLSSSPQTRKDNSTLQKQNTAELSSSSDNQGYLSFARQKVASAYNALPAASTYLPPLPSRNLPSTPSLTTTTDREHTAPPRRGATIPASQTSNITSNLSRSTRPQERSEESSSIYTSPPASPRIEPVNKKVYLWKERLRRAKTILEGRGVEIRLWRTGQDVCQDVYKLVERTQRKMGIYDSNVTGGCELKDIRE